MNSLKYYSTILNKMSKTIYYYQTFVGLHDIMNHVQDVDVIIVPIGGGSSASAACIAAKTINPKVQVIGVQSLQAPAAYHSWNSREIKSAPTSTAAEGLATSVGFELTQSILWEYLDDGSDQSLIWIQIDFDDTAWSTGNAELGYGDGDEETVVRYGPDEDNKYITTYFRQTFNINNPDDIQTLTIRLKRDDGAIIFLNGNEVLRSNMPTGTIAYDTYASSAVSGADEDTFFEWTISANEITDGQNVFAVELHQVSGSSSDISFDLELTGTGYSNTELVDSITFGSQITDVSRGRNPRPAVLITLSQQTVQNHQGL